MLISLPVSALQGLKFAQSATPSFTQVVVTSRSQASADKAAAEHDKLKGVAFDPNDIPTIPNFVGKMIQENKVTYVVINAGERGQPSS